MSGAQSISTRRAYPFLLGKGRHGHLQSQELGRIERELRQRRRAG